MRKGISLVEVPGEVAGCWSGAGLPLAGVYLGDLGLVLVGEPGVPVAVSVLPDIAHPPRQLLGIEPLSFEATIPNGFLGGEVLHLSVGVNDQDPAPPGHHNREGEPVAYVRDHPEQLLTVQNVVLVRVVGEELLPLELPIDVPVKGHALAPPEFLVHALGGPVGTDDRDPVLVIDQGVVGAVGFPRCHPIYPALAVVQGFELPEHEGGVILGVLPETSGHVVGEEPHPRRGGHLLDLFGLTESRYFRSRRGEATTR
jgi:hypothetical protein